MLMTQRAVAVGEQQARVSFFCHLVGPGNGVQVLRLRLCHLLCPLGWWSPSGISISVCSGVFYLTSTML